MNLNLTLAVELVLFLLFFLAVRHTLWPQFIHFLEQREALIQQGLRDADKAREALKNANAEKQALLSEARAEVVTLLKDAKAQANKLLQEARSEAESVRKDLVLKAEQEVERYRGGVFNQLKGQLGMVCVEALEKFMLSDNMTKKDAQKHILQKYAEEVRSSESRA